MNQYAMLAAAILVNGIIALVISLLFKLDLHEVLAGYAFLSAMVSHVNVNTIVKAMTSSGEYEAK